MQDGGFKVATTLGQTWDWLGTINFDVDLPGKIPFGIYSDNGIFINKEGGLYQEPTFMYSVGARFSLLRNVIDIYLPAVFSEEIKENLDLTTSNYFEKIRFSLYLNKINPLNKKSLR